MARWKEDGWKAEGISAMALDPAGGGQDAAELCWRHGAWYAPLITVKGPETADGSAMAARVIRHRRDNCPVVVDAGGGYGGSVALRLKDNGITRGLLQRGRAPHCAHRGRRQTEFINHGPKLTGSFARPWIPIRKAARSWRFRPDDELKADLAAIHWELTASGIKAEAKDRIRERIGGPPARRRRDHGPQSMGQKAIRRRLDATEHPRRS